ncbi:MAG: RtcB family protein [Bacteroidales bacterium]|nr:RtcB family protein [Bacteroidales bacterium]
MGHGMNEKFTELCPQMKITGTYNTAVVFNDHVDNESRNQIQEFCNQEIFRDARIRIMPDVHAGKGCVIGYTASLGSKVVPNLIGLDIGCGIHVTRLGKMSYGYEKLDRFIRQHIPHGFKRNKQAAPGDFPADFIEDLRQSCQSLDIDFTEQLKGVGSLGGGNHFIEIATDSDKTKWLLIHSGSRNFGLQVCTRHQSKAIQSCKEKEIMIPKHFAFLEGDARDAYISDMKVAQRYAQLNRQEMTRRILIHLGISDNTEQFETIHNYINFKDQIIRKGAVSAHQGEKMVIPLNMRDGSLIALGKGNPEWNYSAPHGAGRRLSRNQARKQLDFKDFKKEMKQVWTSTVSEKTLDEAPMAYKPKEELLQYIEESVEISDTLKPVYNFKSE